MTAGKPKSLKETNRKAVIALLRNSDPITIPVISERTSISKTTVIKIIEHFLSHDLVKSHGKGESTDEGGKKPELFTLNNRYRHAVAIHIFKDEVLCSLTDFRGKTIKIFPKTISRNEKIENVIQDIAASTTELLNSSSISPERVLGIGIALPGIVDYDKKTVLFSPWFPSWGEQIPMGKLLKKETGLDIPVFVDNEFRFQVLAEQIYGGHADKQNIIVIGGGEGLGAGIMVENEIKRGVHNIAGEIGHMVINPVSGEQCVCGGHGCFEAMVYRNRLLRLAKKECGDNPESLICGNKPVESITEHDVFDAANRGDPSAVKILDDITYWFAIAISNLIMAHDPEIIIIHGIYTGAGDFFLERVTKKTEKVSLNRVKKNVQIVSSKLGRESGILGAAAHCINEFFKNEDIFK